ncbi:MAG: phosphotransferase enzyme family protein [Paracoccaceae bacterium]
MGQIYTQAFLHALERGLRDNVHLWGLSPGTDISLLNISENATFLARDPEAASPIVLRVHRPDYHTRAEIHSELSWIEDLRKEAVALVPAPVAMTGGQRIGAIKAWGETRDVVAFEYMPGKEPLPSDNLAKGFHQLGAISARLHVHAKSWQRPHGFIRKTWNFDTTVGRNPHWGTWRNAMALTPTGEAVLARVCNLLEKRLRNFGDSPNRFGLIHADLRLANLLIHVDRIGLIDFDDCGFSWFAFDFAAAISFFETDPAIAALQDAWCTGYRSVAPLDPEVVAEMSTFIMLRRLQLTAWIATHSETPTAQELGEAYTDGTLDIAERYLSERT